MAGDSGDGSVSDLNRGVELVDQRAKLGVELVGPAAAQNDASDRHTLSRNQIKLDDIAAVEVRSSFLNAEGNALSGIGLDGAASEGRDEASDLADHDLLLPALAAGAVPRMLA